jgi:hypothetical protein
MKLKLIVKIAMIGSLGVLFVLLVVGVFVPDSVLVRFTKSGSHSSQVTTNTSNNFTSEPSPVVNPSPPVDQNTPSKTVTPTPPTSTCGQGGTCNLSDIQSHNMAANCRSAINATGNGLVAYAITQSFITAHQPNKSLTNILCGKVYNPNLKNRVSEHQDGSTINGNSYQTWINNFYLGPYQ